MLPFLKRKNEGGIAGVIIKNRTPDEKAEGGEVSSHEECAKALLNAIEQKDIKGIANALQEAFKKMDKEPHEEGPHKPSPHSYEAQNAEAAKND